MHVSRRKLLTSFAIASVPPVARARAQAKSTISAPGEAGAVQPVKVRPG